MLSTYNVLNKYVSLRTVMIQIDSIIHVEVF